MKTTENTLIYASCINLQWNPYPYPSKYITRYVPEGYFDYLFLLEVEFFVVGVSENHENQR